MHSDKTQMKERAESATITHYEDIFKGARTTQVKFR